MANPVQPPFQDPGSTSPLELPEMEKLLTKVENKEDKTLNLSKSLSGALDLEQNGHSLPFKVISEGHRQHSLPGSPSRASSRRASSVVTTSYAQDQEAPKDYLILAIASCFCPVWPLNLIPLIFSIMVSPVLLFRAWVWVCPSMAAMSSGKGLKVQRRMGCWNLGGKPLSPNFLLEGPKARFCVLVLHVCLRVSLVDCFLTLLAEEPRGTSG